jgi:hypothetical protein
MTRVTGRRESPTGGNTNYRLSDGKTVTRTQGVSMCKDGKLPGYNVMKVKGKEYLRDNPDKSKKDNIDKQPLI